MRFLYLIFSILIFLSHKVGAQELSNLQQKSLKVVDDTLLLDTLSLVPNSAIIKNSEGLFIADSLYAIDYANAKIIFNPSLKNQTIAISYRTLPILFTKPYYHKSMEQLEESDPGKYDYFTIKKSNQNTEIFSINGLNKNGSISRGVNFGNNQDLSVNSNLDLQLSGKVTDEISIQAAISDNNLPIQPDGNTQQLQEFDRVYIQLYTDKTSLIAGDFLIQRPNSYFMNFNKKVQGGGFNTEIITKEELFEENNGVFKTSINAAISRGKFSRNVIDGVEGIQGPYQLIGDEGETFIIVLSGTERVYVNGRLMKRGQENDYVIDYNTAELTFTPNQIINKDLRIVVEFQYSDQNFGRSVIFSENQYTKEKLSLNLSVYSEQDNKNQPLQQDLSPEDRALMEEVGDNLDQAIISGLDTTGFDNDQVRYKLVDSLGFTDILVYSINPDSAIYGARFSFVGANNGDYIQTPSGANGRVFKWVAPINGVQQGNYEPIIQLITPKQRQMVTFAARYDFKKTTYLSVEGAYTKNDINTFSDKDSGDDNSYGLKVDFTTKERIGGDTIKTFWNSKLFYEQRGKNFQFVERYRNVEFERDWNISNLALKGNEYLISAINGIEKNSNFLDYEFGSFVKGNDYTGIKNGYKGRFVKGKFEARSRGSFLNTESINNSQFLRHYTDLSQKFYSFKVGTYLEQERILFYQGKSDSLQANSFDRIIWKAYIEKGDSTTRNFYRAGYSEVYDYLPNANQEKLNYAQKSENFDLDFNLAKNPNSRLGGKITYRRLLIKDDEISVREPENTLLGRLNYDLRALKGFVNSNTFYQVGSGLENRREFSFLEVNDGQGTHVWIDFNDNGVKELNEFEVAGANNQFQANYIKVFTPTNQFIRVFSNQFSEVLFLKPAAILSGKETWKKWLSKFSNKTAYRVDRKTQEESDIYNPFSTDVEDSSLISINSSLGNTFYFNRLNPKFGIEFFVFESKGKSLLTNGFESRVVSNQEIRLRYNINRLYSFEGKLTTSENGIKSEFFENRNFTIVSNEVQPKIIYQPSVKFRLSLSATYKEKENILGPEKSFNRSLSSELNWNQAGKGSFLLLIDYTAIDYNATANNSLGFEMLEGLSPGNNISWSIQWQRNLSSYLQLNLNYSGRKSDDFRVIHTGGMQVRAFF